MDNQPMLIPIKVRFVRKIEGWRGDAALYHLSEPVRAGFEPFGDEPDDRPLTDYVIISAVIVDLSGPETYIFAATAEGKTFGPMAEMPGSFRGGLDHAEAIEGAGWVLESDVIEVTYNTVKGELNP